MRPRAAEAGGSGIGGQFRVAAQAAEGSLSPPPKAGAVAMPLHLRPVARRDSPVLGAPPQDRRQSGGPSSPARRAPQDAWSWELLGSRGRRVPKEAGFSPAQGWSGRPAATGGGGRAGQALRPTVHWPWL